MLEMAAVTVNNIIKRYTNGKDTVEAVKSVSFEVAKGELFGIIGPDGAGKTSLFHAYHAIASRWGKCNC